MSQEPTYTTGELAKLCRVSVRTIQFYDEKGLLPPSALSDGGRRLYGDEDLRKLSLICLLKTLGLSLTAIKGVLESPDSNEVLLQLLKEQAVQIEEEIDEKQQVRQTIKAMMDDIRDAKVIPATSIGDMERIMQGKKKLKRDFRIMLVHGIICDVIEIGTIVWWVVRGDWVPFAIGMCFVVLLVVLSVRLYYRDTAYVCPHCHAVFKPGMGEFFWSRHTPKTRKLTCTTCGHKDWCVETSSEALDGNGVRSDGCELD